MDWERLWNIARDIMLEESYWRQCRTFIKGVALGRMIILWFKIKLKKFEDTYCHMIVYVFMLA